MRRSVDDRKSEGVSGLPSVFQLAEPADVPSENLGAPEIPAPRMAPGPGVEPASSLQEFEEAVRRGVVRPTAVDVLPVQSRRGFLVEFMDRTRKRWGTRY